MESLNRKALYEAALGNREGIEESAGTYFLKLCAVSAPVTVPQPKSAALQRFRFFFTKGRESYWLHFGYFRTAEEARKWREVLSRVYPGAAIRNLSEGGARQARKGPTLEDTLSELRDSAWQSFDLNDETASTTGVRHLRVEVQTKERPRPAKTSNTGRKL